MGKIAEAYIELTVDSSGARKEITKTEDALAGAGRKMQSSIGPKATAGVAGGFGKIAAAAGGIFAIKQFGDFLGDAGRAAAESAQIGRITESVIKATGGAAGVSAEQINALATALSNKTGIDDELIQQSQNVLLTFKNVQNAGEGQAAMFDRASAAALDMSTVLGGDVSGASMQLGKALNDPVKGIATLGRAGVQFTEEQKGVIKSLVESGDVLGAQSIIMKEVEGQLGGAAEAAADPMQKLSVIAGNLMESFGGGMLDAVGALATSLAELVVPLTPIIEQLGGMFGEAIAALAPAITKVVAALEPMLPQLIDALLPSLPPLAESFAELVIALLPLLPPLAELLTLIVTNGLAPAISLVAAAVASLVPAVTAIITKLTEFVAKVAEMAKTIPEKFGTVVEFFKTLPASIGAVLSALPGVVSGAITSAVAAALSAASSLVQRVGDEIGKLPGKVAAIGGQMLEAGKGIIAALVDGLGSAVTGAGDIARQVVNAIISLVNSQVIARFNDMVEFSIPLPFGASFDVDPPDIPGIPMLHNGGFTGAEGLHFLDNRELVLPLKKPQRAVELINQSGLAGRSGNEITQTFNISTLGNPETVARRVANRSALAARR